MAVWVSVEKRLDMLPSPAFSGPQGEGGGICCEMLTNAGFQMFFHSAFFFLLLFSPCFLLLIFSSSFFFLYGTVLVGASGYIWPFAMVVTDVLSNPYIFGSQKMLMRIVWLITVELDPFMQLVRSTSHKYPFSFQSLLFPNKSRCGSKWLTEETCFSEVKVARIGQASLSVCTFQFSCP